MLRFYAMLCLWVLCLRADERCTESAVHDLIFGCGAEQPWANFVVRDLRKMQSDCFASTNGTVQMRYSFYDYTHDPLHWIDYGISIYLVYKGLPTPHMFFRGESTRDAIEAQYNLRDKLFRASYVITAWCEAVAEYGVDDEL